MAKRKINNLPAVKAGMFSNYSQWWLSGGDISSLMGAALLFSDTPFGRAQAAKFNVWAANCIAARSETLASVELKLYKKSDDPDEEDEVIPEHPVLDLLERVNPINLNKTTFREQIERQLSIHGDCYIHKVRGAKGLVDEMYILPAQLIEPIPDATRLVGGYRYQASIVLAPEDVIRIYYTSDENPILARSPLTSAINAINNYSLSDLAQQGIDRRGGQGGGIVMVDFNSIAGDPQRFMAEWDAKRSDPRNAGRDAFLPTDSNYQSGTLTAQQQQREERAIRLIREIMGAFRVPPSLAGDYKDASVLANAAQQDKNFWVTFMKFELKRLEDAINYDLLWREYDGAQDEGLYLKHDLSEVEALSEGMDAEANRNQVKVTTADTAFAAGLVSLNEARIDIGKEPIDDPRADEVLQPEVDPMTGQPAEDTSQEDLQDPEVDSLLEEAAAVKAVEDLLVEVDDFLLELGSESFLDEPVKAVDKDGDGFVYDNTSKERPATAEEKRAGRVPDKARSILKSAQMRMANKKKGGKGAKPKKTEEQKAAEKEQKHQEKVKAQVAQIDDYTDKLQAELERLTKLGDSFKDESNLRKRLGQAVKRLKAKKARLMNSNANVDSGAEDLLSEAGTKALDAPYRDSAWVGFYLSTHDAQAIENEQLEAMGECEDRPHLTLAMTRALTDDEVFSIGFKLNQIAEQFKPVQGKISGTGVFNQEETDCLYASFDSPQLPALREAVAKALGDTLDETHGYTPHITLCYCEKGKDTSAIEIPLLDMTLPTLTFAVGSVNYNYVLGYGYAGEQDWADAVEEEEEEEIEEETEEVNAYGVPTHNKGQDHDYADWDDEMIGKASYRPVPFFDLVGQKAFAKTPEGRVYGEIEQIKRFGEYEGLTAAKDNPVVFISGKAYQSTDVELLINE